MTFTKTIQLFLIFLFIANIGFAQSEVILPTHADGRPIICEKFEMLEKTLPNLHLLNNTITPPFLPNQQSANTRTGDEIQVGESNKREFEVHAAVNPTNPSNIIVASMKLQGTAPALSLDFTIYYTNDFGDTWQKSNFNGTLPGQSIVGGGDPMIVFDETGKAYFSWLLVTFDPSTLEGTWGLYMATSNNGGNNWTIDLNNTIEEETFTDLFTLSDLQKASDKEWMVSDLSPTSPHYGNIYISYVDIDIANDIYNIKVKTKKANSSSFNLNANIISTQNYEIAQFTSIDVAKNGDVYATFFASTTGNNYGIYVAKSTDGGNTFSTEQKISNIAFPVVFSGSNPVAGIDDNRLYPCPHVAVDKSDGVHSGNIYVTWTAYGVNSQITDGFDIYISSSADGGQTWSTPTVINNDQNTDVHQLYSSIEVTRTGIVVASWYDRRDDPVNNVFTDYYMGYSIDGGVTFDQFPVSTQSSDFNQINSGNNDLGPGEYNQIVTVSDFAIPFWGDGRTDNGNIAVYGAFWNLSTLSNEPEKIANINTKFSFSEASPNPIIDIANFELILKESSSVSILLYDLSGKEISTLLNKNILEGTHDIELNFEKIPSGEYFVTINTDFGFQTKKAIIVK